MKDLITIRHLTSGATTEVEFMGFDRASFGGPSATVRYGLTGLHTFRLRSGQGVGNVVNWEVVDIDQLRARAESEGLVVGITSKPVAVHRRKPKPKPAGGQPAPISEKQIALFGGE